MGTYQTKTGITLTVIQGLNQGNGIKTGNLKIVDSTIETDHCATVQAEMDHVRSNRVQYDKNLDLIKSKWGQIVGHLTLKQYRKITTNKWIEMAQQAKTVSKSKNVFSLANEMIEICNKTFYSENKKQGGLK